MRDVHGMARRGGVEVFARDEALLRGLGVVVLESGDPFAGRSLRGPLAHCVLDRGDGTQVAVDEAQVAASGVGGVAVRVDEAGDDRLAAEVDFSGVRAGEVEDVGLGADGENAPTADCDRLGLRLPGIHRQKTAVVQDQLRPLPQDRGQRGIGKCGKRCEAAGTLQQVPAGHDHVASYAYLAGSFSSTRTTLRGVVPMFSVLWVTAGCQRVPPFLISTSALLPSSPVMRTFASASA